MSTQRKRVQFLSDARGCACCDVRYYRLWYDTVSNSSKCWGCLTPSERDWRLPIFHMLTDPRELPISMQSWANLQENLVCRKEGGCYVHSA